VLQTMVPAIVNDVETHPGVYRPTQQVANVKKALTVPLITGTGAIGVLTVVNRESDFGDDDARVLQRLADHVAVAIVNARLFEEAADATREWRVSFDAIPLGMVVVDAAGRILRSNANAAPLAGLTDGTELVGLEFHEAVLGLSAGEAPDSPLPAAIGGETRRVILRAPWSRSRTSPRFTRSSSAIGPSSKRRPMPS
jgi:PAS domain-containing protein